MTRLAIVMNRVPHVDELAPTALGIASIERLDAEADVLLFVDRESEGLELLRDAGVEVHLSAKRYMEIDGERLSADALQARALVAAHRAKPMDRILYADDVMTDFAWFESELAEIPRIVVLGHGPSTDAKLLVADPLTDGSRRRALWQAISLASSADAVVSSGDVRGYGLDSTGLPDILPFLEAPAGTLPIQGPLIVVVARSASPTELAGLFWRVWTIAEDEPTTTLAIIHADQPFAAITTAELILAGIPSELQQRVVLVAARGDGVASRLVSEADTIICLHEVDLAGVVTRGTAASDVICLEPGRTREGTGASWNVPVRRRSRPDSGLVEANSGVAAAADDIDSVADACDVVFVYEPDGATVAAKLASLPVADADTYLAGADSGVFGMVDPQRVSPFAVGLRSEVWFSMRDDLSRFGAVWDVIRRLSSIDQMEYLRQLVIPIDSCRTREISWLQSQGPVLGGRGVLPRPAIAIVEPTETVVPAQPGVSEPSLRDWAKDHGWSDRARLALPWKWGMLPRSMKGRW